jgi:DNA gyrase subunit A
MMISDTGIIMRTPAGEISKLGRDTQGVIVMRLDSGKVSTVAVVPHEDEEELAEGGENAENGESAPETQE